MSSLINDIIQGLNVRSNLLELKELLKSEKEGNQKASLLIHVQSNFGFLVDLLSDPDPKIRKNAAACLYYAGSQETLEPLYKAYCAEETNYVRSTYLKAISVLDHTSVNEGLSKRRSEILNSTIEPENTKHALEEMKLLNSILPGDKKHTFTGYELVNEFVLTTNRNFKNITAEKLGKLPHKEFTAGIMVKTKQLRFVESIRTYEELLLIPDNVKNVAFNPKTAAAQLAEGGLVDYISERHDASDIPFRFRVELRCKDQTAKSDFEKVLANQLELLTNWKLVNSTSDYELEIRLIETKEGSLNVLLKLMTLKDPRFTYKKESISAGLKPHNAALIAELGKKYYLQNASVLDPFCGVGTLLVERDRVLPARILYGIDIFGEAVQKAHTNIKASGISSKCELINRDFFDFKHEYRFNEIITELPYNPNYKADKELDGIYKKLFTKLPVLLEKDNHEFIYTRNRELLRKHALTNNFKILEEYEISKKEEAYLFVLTY